MTREKFMLVTAGGENVRPKFLPKSGDFGYERRVRSLTSCYRAPRRPVIESREDGHVGMSKVPRAA